MIYVCAKCLAEDSLSRLVTVEGWESIEVSLNDKGILVEDSTGERDIEWYTSEFMSYHCSHCGSENLQLEKAVKVKPQVECRDCGFLGDSGEGHPDTCKGELVGLDPPEIHPQQTKIV